MNIALFSGLADVRAWQREGRNVSPIDFVALEGKPSLLFAYAALMDPELTKVDGLYYLSSGFNEGVLLAWNEKGVRGADAQRVINHVHLRYLMQEDGENVEVLSAAAEVLFTIWNKTLPADFVVEIVEQGTANVALTFYQDT